MDGRDGGSGERFDFTDLRRDGKPLPTGGQALHRRGRRQDHLPLVPVVDGVRGAVPQAAGRGLGHTGGTLDKLEAIAGFTAELSKDQIRQQLYDIGAAIFAAGGWRPPTAKIYALRDVTATTESLPLIASSVMSKKLAEGRRMAPPIESPLRDRFESIPASPRAASKPAAAPRRCSRKTG